MSALPPVSDGRETGPGRFRTPVPYADSVQPAADPASEMSSASDFSPSTGDSLPDLADGFRLAGWDVDPRRNRASRGDAVESIEPKVMQVLLVLARHAGEPVTRDLLMETVWPDVIVTDDTLTRCISEARKIFDRPVHADTDADGGPEAHARAGSVIETIPKVGYSLIAPVAARLPRRNRRPSSPGDVSVRPTVVSAANPTGRRPLLTRSIAILIVFATVSVAVVAGSGLLSGIDESGTPVLGSSVPATSLTGTETMPAWSPGGDRLAFVHSPEAGDVSILMAGEPGDARPIELFASPRGSIRAPVWMPDGDRILFVHLEQDGCRIRSVPALGGPARELARCNGSFATFDISPDGATIAMDDRPSSDAPVRIELLEVATGTRTPIPNDRSDRHDYAPVFSPDGRSVIFARSLGEGQMDLFEFDRSTKTVERLTYFESGIAGHDMDDSGQRMYFSQGRAGHMRLHVLDLITGSVHDLSIEGMRPAVSATRIVYEAHRVDSDIMVGDGGGTRTVCDSTRNDRFPAVDPTGRFITFVSDRAGAASLYRCDLETGLAQSIGHGNYETVLAPQVDPDGRIAYMAVSAGEADVFVIDRPDEAPRRLTSTGSNDIYPSFSPDGDWIYFGSDRSGGMDIWRMPVGGGQAERVTHSGGMVPRLSTDGSTLYFQREGIAGLWRISLDDDPTDPDPAPAELVDDRIDLSASFGWIPVSEGVLVAVRSKDGVIGLELLDPDTGLRQPVRRLTEGRLSYGFTATLDFSVIAVSILESVDSDLMTATIRGPGMPLDSGDTNR